MISTAAIGNEQVQALVYFNGWMCDVGESQQQLLEKFEGSLVGPSIRPVPFTNPDGSEGIDLYLAPEAFHEAFAADVDPETAAVMATAQRPYAAAAFAATPWATPAWSTLPCWYLLGTEDKAIPPAVSSGSWPTANATIVEVAASHVSFVSQPEAADPTHRAGRRSDHRSQLTIARLAGAMIVGLTAVPRRRCPRPSPSAKPLVSGLMEWPGESAALALVAKHLVDACFRARWSWGESNPPVPSGVRPAHGLSAQRTGHFRVSWRGQ